MIVWTSVVTDNRVLREATALVDAGHQVHIIGKDVPVEFVPPAGVTVESASGSSALKRASGSATAQRMSVPVRAARWVLMPQHIAAAHRSWVDQARARVQPGTFDVIHAHDFTALPLAAELAGQAGVPYVYDTHEYWYGRSPSGRPTPLRRRADRRTERALGSAAAAVITVGDGIADQLKADFGWDVTVVRNTFPENVAPAGATAPGSEVVPSAAPTGVVYAGRVGEHRDLEVVAKAAPLLAPLRVTVVGPADATFRSGFVGGSIELLDSLTVDGVTELLRSQGVALVTLAGRGENHRLAMPNKLFHAVHAGVPVVAANVEHLARIVTRYELGTLYEPGDVDSLVAAVRDVVARYPLFVAGVRAAASELSWTRDAQRLVGVYAALASREPARTREQSTTSLRPRQSGSR